MKPRRKGGALVSFGSYGMPHDMRLARTAERITKAEAVREIDLMQATRDKPGDRIFKPVKPPPYDFGPRRSDAAARDAAAHNGKQQGPVFSPVIEVATDYYVPTTRQR